MSDTVSFGGGIIFPARPATVEAIFDYLIDREPDHAEFRALVALRDHFDAIGGWFFDDLSPDALRHLQRLMDEMAEDLPAAAARANWNEEWKPTFYANVERFRAKLADRIAQFG